MIKASNPSRRGSASPRVDAALRFLEGRDLSGAGCARGNQTCMAEALVAMDWASQYPVREFHEGGFTDPCLPAFGVNGCGIAFDPHTHGGRGDRSEHPRAVRGAVDDFFSGTAYAAPDLQSARGGSSSRTASVDRGWWLNGCVNTYEGDDSSRDSGLYL